MYKSKKQKGITLIALIITIIILLILAGITITQLTQSGLFEKAKEAKQRTENAQNEENAILSEYETTMNGYISGTVEASGGQTPEVPKDPTLPINPATTVEEAQSDYMLTKTVNSPIEDENGNKIIIPAGFKIKVDSTTNNAKTVDKGIVIVDSKGNEFVWIPVGKIYRDKTKTEENAKIVELNRYTFDSNGDSTAQNDAAIPYSSNNFQELAESTSGNKTAKDINAFKTKTLASKGFYVGRYEARKPIDSLDITEIGTDYLRVTDQSTAVEEARSFSDATKPYSADLMNSYAWDTMILFLQSFGDNPKYSRQISINNEVSFYGTSDKTKYTGEQDVQCNVYDVASNYSEWTTETFSYNANPAVLRGCYAGSMFDFASSRNGSKVSNVTYAYRPILYL